MPVALEGALIGVAIGVFLVVAEYYFVVKAAKERARRKHQFNHVIDGAERKRILSIMGFSLFLPPAFAIFFWLIWG